ncbi:MAG: hypothetical protein ACXVB0_25080, partial [Mucilaginibacter sp.]
MLKTIKYWLKEVQKWPQGGSGMAESGCEMVKSGRYWLLLAANQNKLYCTCPFSTTVFTPLSDTAEP